MGWGGVKDGVGWSEGWSGAELKMGWGGVKDGVGWSEV